MYAVLCGGQGDQVVLGHSLVDLGAPVVDRDEDGVGIGGGGQQGLGVRHQGGLGLLRPSTSSSSS